MIGGKRHPDLSVTEHESRRPSFSPPLRFYGREKTLEIMDQCLVVEGSAPGQEITKWPGLYSHLSTQQRQTSVKLILKGSENSHQKPS